MVGNYSGPGGNHAFLFAGTNLTDLGTLPGGLSSSAYGINNAGQVVGVSFSQPGSKAFVYLASEMWNLNALMIGPEASEWTLQEARGINDSGQITGNGLHNGKTRGFLLTPVPVIRPQLSPAGNFELSFWAMTNRNYLIQWSPDLFMWNELTNVIGKAAFLTVSDTVIAATNRYYRVIQQ